MGLNKIEETFYKTFFEEHSAPMLIVAKDGKIVKANKSALNFYGYTEEEITSMYSWQINTLPKDIMDKLVKEAILRKENFFRFKHRLKNGEIRDVNVYSSPVIINDEEYLISIIHDVTEETKYQTFFNMIKNIEDISIASKSREEFFIKLIDIFKQNENISDICIAIKSNDTLIPKFEYGQDHCIKELNPNLNQDKYIFLPVFQAFSKNDIIINKDTSKNPYLETIKDEMLKSNRYSSASIPILENNKVIGSMCICANRPNYFDKHEDFFKELKSLINNTLSRFKLEEELKTSKEFFEAVSENATNGIVVYDMDKIYYINKSLIKLLKYSKDEISSLNIFDILSPRHVQDIINSFLHSKNIKGHFLVVDKNGNYIDVYFSSSVINTPNGKLAIANITDISEIIRNQHIIEIQRKLLQDIIDRIEGGIIVFKVLNNNKVHVIYKNSFFDGIDINLLSDILGDDINQDNIIKSLIDNKNFTIEELKFKDKIVKVYLKLLDEEEELTMLGIFYDITKEYNIAQAYKSLSELDHLTGICNRRCYNKSLETYIALAKRYKRPLSLIMCDIDYFKRINDSFGHDAGDFVLKTIASLISKNIRNTDVFARYGGEEFMIITPETTLKDAVMLAEKLRNLIESTPIFYNDIDINLTCSFGVSELREEDTIQSLEKRVDELLYISKKSGRNKVSYNLNNVVLPPPLKLTFNK